MNAWAPTRPQIDILGGGVSGAATAWNLARSGVDADVIVVEPRAQIGPGLAYLAMDPAHRINVPAAKMSIDPDRPSHFIDWLASPRGSMLDPATLTPKGDLFPPRSAIWPTAWHQCWRAARYAASGRLHKPSRATSPTMAT